MSGPRGAGWRSAGVDDDGDVFEVVRADVLDAVVFAVVGEHHVAGMLNWKKSINLLMGLQCKKLVKKLLKLLVNMWIN